MYKKLKQRVCRANMALGKSGLVICSWGNVSAMDRQAGVVAIKPSGVAYEKLTPDMIVVLDLEGNRVEGDLRPSSDTWTHLELYRGFDGIGGVCHTHSMYATMWAQACRDLPCLGTTSADYFYGTVPVTEPMAADMIASGYEANTGKTIIRRFTELNPADMPAVLVAGHGPFTWGKDAAEAVEAAIILEQVAQMALGTVMLSPDIQEISAALLEKHYFRKHGKDAYYGQK